MPPPAILTFRVSPFIIIFERVVIVFRIPKKYQPAIKEVYKDEDGVWCNLNDGWVHGVDGTHVIHCETYTELRSELPDIRKDDA